MRTNIDIDDELLAAAMRATGLTTKKAVVEASLRLLVRRDELRQVIKDSAGMWADDEPAMRDVAEDGATFRHE